MPNYLHRTDDIYLTSTSPANLPEPIANYIRDPDLSAVDGFLIIYWDIDGDIVKLLNKPARDSVDDDIATAQDLADKESEKSRMDVEKVLIALAKVMMKEFNILRAEHGLSARTLSQLKTAIKNEIDNQ